MSCVPAPACLVALGEASHRWPNRRRTSDGICASEEHRRSSPNSDHNSGDAFDLSHDPANGVDCAALAALLVERRDQRVAYIIFAGRIVRSYTRPKGSKGPDGVRTVQLPAWTWERYTGSNQHHTHMHVSIVRAQRPNAEPWWEDDTMNDADRQLLNEVHSMLAEALPMLRTMNHHINGQRSEGARLPRAVHAAETLLERDT